MLPESEEFRIPFSVKEIVLLVSVDQLRLENRSVVAYRPKRKVPGFLTSQVSAKLLQRTRPHLHQDMALRAESGTARMIPGPSLPCKNPIACKYRRPITRQRRDCDVFESRCAERLAVNIPYELIIVAIFAFRIHQ
jgi:hypothetical protein